VAGPPGLEGPGPRGAAGPRLINHVSSGNHQMETYYTNAYHLDIRADNLETYCRAGDKGLIAPMNLMYK